MVAGPVDTGPARGRYLIVPRSSMRLPCLVQPVPLHVITCSWGIGKWSLEVVLTTPPGSRNGLAVSLLPLVVMRSNIAQFMLFLSIFCRPHIVQGIAPPYSMN